MGFECIGRFYHLAADLSLTELLAHLRVARLRFSHGGVKTNRLLSVA